MNTVYFHTRLQAILAGLLFVSLTAATLAQNLPEEMTDPADRATYQWLLERAGKQPHVQRSRKGAVQWIGYQGESKYTASLYLDEQGRVFRLMFNKPGLNNDDLTKLAQFKHVTQLTLWHNFDEQGPNGYRIGPNPMSGAGWIAFKDHGVTSFHIGGCNFDGDGLRALAAFPNVQHIACGHTRVNNADLAALRGHPALTSISLSPMWGDQITDAAFAHLAQIPSLQKIRINETFLTFKNGLRHLKSLRGVLQEVDLDNCVIAPEDVQQFRQAMPGVTVTQKPAEEIGRLLHINFKGAYRKLSKRAPKELLDRFVTIYKASTSSDPDSNAKAPKP